jgi:hypothetical protein
VTVANLRLNPFIIQWGSSIYARIVATNVYGSSKASDAGNGAVILTYPDAPTNLAVNSEITVGSTVGLTWDEGAQNGGTAVLDYTVYSRSSLENDWTIRSSIVGTSATLVNFNLGLTYFFKVQARSAFDFSLGYSNEVSVLTAIGPNQPDAPTTTVDAANENVII